MNEPSTNSERVLKFLPAGPPRFYEFGPFCLDSIDRQLLRSGQSVPLPPKTVETLLALVQRHGQLVMKEALISALWPETFVEESNLTHQIFRLRKTLGDDSESERYIETVPRRGYRFVGQVIETNVRTMGTPRQSGRRLKAILISVTAAAIIAATTILVAHHERRPTIAPPAQEAYLKGMYHFNRRTRPDFLQAVEYFRSAVEQEPRFALAWTNLGNAYSFLGENPRAKVAAQRALEIDEQLAEAHATLGITSLLYDFDSPAAERHFKRAIELNPSYPTAHHWYAFCLVSQRRFDEALAEIERARSLDPTSLIINTDVAQILLYARHYDQAIEKLREVLKLDANFEQAHLVLMDACLRMGDYQAAAEELRSHPQGYFSAELAAATGDRSRALASLQEMERIFHRDPVVGDDFCIARLHAALRNDEASIGWLEKSLALRDAQMAMVDVDPGFDSLRGNPRFQALLRRMKLPTD